uniref:HECT-type E3 ubiquitin transferase n=1 Tax=Aceria tosichella TaxID=561515 RepID=A0A6G1SIY8_9ACAR
MAVSSLKGCWSKLSARIRDYIDVVDSYYRPADENLSQTIGHTPGAGAGGDPSHYHRRLILQSPNGATNTSHKSCTTHHKSPKSTSNNTSHHHSKDRRIANIANNKSTVHNHHHHHHHHHHEHQHETNCSSYQRTINQLIALDTTQPQQQQTSSPAATHTSRSASACGYTKRKTTQGQVYFVDQNGHKSWYDPSVPKELLTATLDLDYLVGPLSSNWEIGRASTGKVYFINHLKKTTQFTDPRLITYKEALMGYLKRNATNNELYDKISILRQELLKQQVLSHPCKIDINRKRIFEESFRAVSQMQPRDLKKRLLIKFRGEEGLDYGGVAREWFYLLSREILNPNHGLFQYTSDDNYNLQINPDSKIVYSVYREHLAYMNFCGRIIGMAVFHGHFIEGRFTLPFYKMLLRKPITLDDIEFVDPDLHRSLCWMLENDITDVIDTTFLVQHNAFGQLQEHELKPGGREIQVTEENKAEYVSLYVNYRCRRGIENQFNALQRGFYELIQPNLVENFDEHELELLIGGLSKINIEDWRTNTKLKNCTVDTPLVRWFWDIVKSYDEDKRARLLQFVTGSPRVPIQGFKALQGVNSELRLFTIHLIKNGKTDNLPKSHTCFNRIDLPPYETYDKLRDKLTQAIEETMGFAMQ